MQGRAFNLTLNWEYHAECKLVMSYLKVLRFAPAE